MTGAESSAPKLPAKPKVPGTAGPRWSRYVGVFLTRGVWSTRVVGAENVPASGPVIIVGNHTSVIDGPLLMGIAPRPLHILIKQEMFKGALGVFLSTAGQIPVDRDSGRQALVTGRAVLQRGGALGIFPEGSRGDGDVSDAHGGAAWLALNTDAVVVPAAIMGTRRPGESVSNVPGFRRKFLVEFGPAFSVTREPGTTGKQALAMANETLRSTLASLVVAASARAGIPMVSGHQPGE